MAKEAIISTSALNCYGTRVLTSGVDLEQYRKNPILLYMHRRGGREDMPIGIIDNLRVDGDMILGTPKFDGDTEAEKLIEAKWERGTLRMLSPYIDIVETSEDPETLVPGQTRPTVTKSKLVEVSIVDIGGNDEALQVRLSRGGKALTLAMGEECDALPLLKSNTAQEPGPAPGTDSTKPIKTSITMEKILLKLGLPATATEEQALAAIDALMGENSQMKLARIGDAVEAAIAERRITAEKKDQFIELGKKAGLDALKANLALFEPAPKPLDVVGGPKPAGGSAALKWEDMSGEQIADLRTNNKDEYIRLYKEHYGFAPEI